MIQFRLDLDIDDMVELAATKFEQAIFDGRRYEVTTQMILRVLVHPSQAEVGEHVFLDRVYYNASEGVVIDGKIFKRNDNGDWVRVK